MAEQNAERGTGNAETGADDAPGPSVPHSELRVPSSALRSTFGFDRNDEQWLAAVRDGAATAMAAAAGGTIGAEGIGEAAARAATIGATGIGLGSGLTAR